MTVWRRGVAGVIALTALVVFGVAIRNLMVFARSRPNPITAGDLKRVEPTETGTIGGEELCGRSSEQRAPLDVTLLVHEVDPERGVLEGALRFNPVAEYQTTPSGVDKKIPAPGGLVFPARSKIRVQVSDTFGSAYEAFSVATSRLRVFTLSKPTRGVLRPVSFSIASWSSMYPMDRYLLGVDLDLDLIDGRGREKSVLPVSCALFMGAGVHDLVADAQLRGATSPGFILDLSRKSSTQVFVWLVALSPLLFALMILHGLFFRSLTPQVFGIGTGLALLSIFSLRQVLIPQNLPGITLLDLVLGAEVAALTLLAAAAFFLASAEPPLSVPKERVGSTKRAGNS